MINDRIQLKKLSRKNIKKTHVNAKLVNLTHKKTNITNKRCKDRQIRQLFITYLEFKNKFNLFKFKFMNSM